MYIYMIDLLKEYIETFVRAKQFTSKLKHYIADEIIKQIPALAYERHNLMNTDTVISNEYKLYFDYNIENLRININMLANYLGLKKSKTEYVYLMDKYGNEYRYSIDDIVYTNKTDEGHLIDTYEVNYPIYYGSGTKTKNYYRYYHSKKIVQQLKLTIRVRVGVGNEK